jgi:maleate cis-trans isomerase
MSGVDRLGWRRKFGVIAPSTNTIVQPEFDMMRVPGVTSHYGRIYIPDGRIGDDAGMEALLVQIRENMDSCVERLMTMQPDYMVMGMSAETFWDGVEATASSSSRSRTSRAASASRPVRKPASAHSSCTAPRRSR